MSTTPPSELDRFTFDAARSLFRSLFMDDWQTRYPTWEAAISIGSLEWSFTAEKFRTIASELDQLAMFPEADVRRWISQACSGLPAGSPIPDFTSLVFVRRVQFLVSQLC